MSLAAATLLASLALATITAASPLPRASLRSHRHITTNQTGAIGTHFVAGFGIDTPARVSNAAAVGVDTAILYEGAPAPASALGQALAQAHMRVIDARLSGALYYWECHRTHTVAPPPEGQPNEYCATDEDPQMNSPAAVLASVREYLREDEHNPLVSGYWMLDDWAWWDGGSARELLPQVRAAIEEATPGYPAICGFGGEIQLAGESGGFALSTALNYSPGACSMVGLYNYTSPTRLRRRSSGQGYEWTMSTLLREEQQDLAKQGWSAAEAPILGIGQAWAGRYGHHTKYKYEPGLSAEQMLQESRAFCAAGASALAWYGWDDSGFRRATMTPNNSPAIKQGIEESIAACPAVRG